MGPSVPSPGTCETIALHFYVDDVPTDQLHISPTGGENRQRCIVLLSNVCIANGVFAPFGVRTLGLQ